MNTSQRRRLAGTLKNTAYGSHIRRRITSADGPLTRGNSDAAGARRLTCADTLHKRRPRKVTSGPHPAKSSSGRLFRNDTTILYSLSSHSLKQWGQLGEILGGVRFPESGASRWLVQPPMIREVVSNRINQK